VRLIETKATRTPTPDMAAPMRKLADAFGKSGGARRSVEMSLVHRAPRRAEESRVIAPGVQAIPWQAFVY
jgi:hypothetical protein